jgi:hypothetical protein
MADTKMRPETTSEHIARDMREGRFPEQSERQMVPVQDAMPDEITAWPSDVGPMTGSWSANTYHDERAVTYVRGDAAQAIRAAALEGAATHIITEAERLTDDMQQSDPALEFLKELAAEVLSLIPSPASAALEAALAQRERETWEKAAKVLRDHGDTARKKLRETYDAGDADANGTWSCIVAHLDIAYDALRARAAEGGE